MKPMENKNWTALIKYVNLSEIDHIDSNISLPEQSININYNVHFDGHKIYNVDKLLVYKVENHPIFEEINQPGIINKMFKRHLDINKEFI